MRVVEVAIRAYGKVNLYLRVKGRRSDGFHEIQTILHPIGLFDELIVERRDRGFELVCESPESPLGKENTVHRAWEALKRFCPDFSGGCRVILRKSIPAQGGLGGGSADAAAALLAMDRLFGLGLEGGTLSRLAATIGSDVPFFLGSGAAEASGRGEIVRAIPSALDAPATLALSNRGVSTAEAYARFVPDPAEEERSPAALLEALAAGRCESVAQHLFNTFERLVFPVRPDLARTKAALIEAGAAGALLSGSGATVFAMGGPAAEALPFEKAAVRDEGRAVATRFCARPYEWL